MLMEVVVIRVFVENLKKSQYVAVSSENGLPSLFFPHALR